MPIQTRQATTFVNGFGGTGLMVNPTVASHDNSNVAVGSIGAVDTKSIKWQDFLGVNGKVNSIRVKFDWVRTASQSGGGLESWSIVVGDGVNGDTAISEVNVTGTSSGSVDLLLVNCANSPIPSLSIIETIQASVPIIEGTASITTSISNVRFDIDFTPYSPHMIVMM